MSVEDTLKERGNRYGDFTDHARICQSLKRAMISSGYDNLPDIHRQALEVIMDKVARILSGDPNYADNWHDIQGYAKLVEDRLPKEGVAPAKRITYNPTKECQHLVPLQFTCVECEKNKTLQSVSPTCKHGNSGKCSQCIYELTGKQ